MICMECYTEYPEGTIFCERCGFLFQNSSEKDDSKVLKDRYRIISPLFVGGVGSISLGYDVRLNKLCAIKEIFRKGLEELPQDKREEILKPFKREAEILAKLRHPNLPCVTDYFIENDICYLVMDYIEGKDLELILEEAGEDGLQEKQVLEWTIQICNVLEYLHDQKPPIIHGDVKLANLIIRDTDKRIMVVDFGSASFADMELDEKNREGTVGYAPPEQYDGIKDVRSDIYSLGVSIYELLTAVELPTDFNFMHLRDIRNDISPDLEAIIMKCLSYNVENRFENTSLLKQFLLKVYREHFSTRKKTKTAKLIQEPEQGEDFKEDGLIKIMVVDDDPIICNIFNNLSRFFEDIKIIDTVSSGKDALERVKEDEPPDVILMDINMGEMGGIETTKNVLSVLPSAKVIFMTGTFNEQDFYECFKAGGAGYILKEGTSWEDIKGFIRAAYKGETVLSENVDPSLLKKLTSQSLFTHKVPDKEKPVEDETVKCPHCKKINNEKAKFCQQCGVNIKQFQEYKLPQNIDPEPIINKLKEGNSSVRFEALSELIKLNYKDITSYLLNGLNDINHNVVKLSAMTLGEIGDRSSIEPLRETMKRLGESCISMRMVIDCSIMGIERRFNEN